MVELTTISTGQALLELAPSMGSGIARLDVAGRPVLRPWNGNSENPFSLASNVLVPFSNRISGGGFDWDGTHHGLTPNLPGEVCPIHGDGFQKQWSAQQSGTTARLTLQNGAFGPWRYQAVQDFTLTDTSVTVELTLTNTGPDPLPFGCGFHPWFPRTAGTRLSFSANTVWMEDSSNLPTEELDLFTAPNWDFAQSRPLPSTWINNGYTGWHGPARIDQGEGAVSCTVTASGNLSTALVFSSNSEADFFCFEPVSHPVDAFHLPGYPGLQSLSNGETMRAEMTIDWSTT
jgi:aldose 1-epimerase